jgi:tripartite-type tricarboxylate transporter receptor subunit TctC
MPTIRLIAAVAALVAATVPAMPQDWPSRPVSLVVPFAAGGPMDVVGRILALRMSEVLRQQVVVENIGGAGGMTGSARVAKGEGGTRWLPVPTRQSRHARRQSDILQESTL